VSSPRSVLAPFVAVGNATWPRFNVLTLLAATSLLTGCDLRISGSSFWGDESSKLSPRVVELGQPVPKGGGRYKVGAPYRVNGKLYVPREDRHYVRTGTASWYGELFHGRRTANGEIYDMEALTAAHRTLPLPSYARVTNLRNGRSLVVRVNDRGPYANNRIIDLSWAVASLLRMRRAGTAPVRVEYLGPAPLSGGDNYERRVLARQPWAGPRVAFARSPAKAMRFAQASQTTRYSVTRSQKTASLAPRPAKQTRNRQAAARPVPPMPASRPHKADRPHRIAARANGRDMDAAPNRRKDAPRRFVSTADLRLTDPPLPRPKPASRSLRIESVATTPAAIYVEAGLFSEKPLAERLAAILMEIAPTSIEPATLGASTAHRIRLGPFEGREAAYAAVERIRAAGLKDARVADSVGG
jgi:rare lipoprotein A